MKLLIAFAFTSLAAFVLSAWPHKLASGRGNDALEVIHNLDTGQSKLRPGQANRSPWQAR